MLKIVVNLLSIMSDSHSPIKININGLVCFFVIYSKYISVIYKYYVDVCVVKCSA